MNIEKKYTCPLCGKMNNKKYFVMPGYSLAKCINCGMIWDYEPPSYLYQQYEKTYFINDNPKGGYANYIEGMRVNKKTFKKRLNKIEKILGRKGKLLDVGCALGDFLMVAKEQGWKDSEGLEISKYACKYAIKRRLKVSNSLLVNKKFNPNSFDVICYQDVIEHLPNPILELKEVYKVLKPGGYVFIITPDVDGFWSKLLGSMWYHYKPNEHIMYFSQKTMNSILTKVGFIKIKTGKSYHILSLEYILNRLRYYFPNLLKFFRNIVIKLGMGNLSFYSYTGELEAWAQKPLN